MQLLVLRDLDHRHVTRKYARILEQLSQGDFSYLLILEVVRNHDYGALLYYHKSEIEADLKEDEALAEKYEREHRGR